MENQSGNNGLVGPAGPTRTNKINHFTDYETLSNLDVLRFVSQEIVSKEAAQTRRLAHLYALPFATAATIARLAYGVAP